MGKLKFTRKEKSWILYDVGNSAFVMLVATILPIYFNSMAGNAGISEVNAMAYWGYAVSVSTILVALTGPVLGAMADRKGLKKPLFLTCVAVGVLACGSLWLPSSWFLFLCLFVIAKVGYNTSLIFYDAMLVDVTEPERLDVVSSNGYAWGYIGSCVPFIASLVLVLCYKQLGISIGTAMCAAFILNALWWLFMTLPLLKTYEQKWYVEQKGNMLRESLTRLWKTLAEMRSQKQIFLYLLSFFFFIDGVYTIIEMATAYGSALGLDSSGLLLALLVTQIVAFPCALVFSGLSAKYETGSLLKVCIAAYIGIILFAIQLDKQWEYWLLAVLVGMFQGGIQALARSYFAKIIPAEKSGEYFGIYDICGKGASFMGTMLTGLVAQITGHANAGVAAIAVLFVIGFILFSKVDGMQKEAV